VAAAILARAATRRMLADITETIKNDFAYAARDTEGTQTPTQTLALRMGSCRDFAVLFTEAARKLGFGARLVSGYLHDPNHDLVGSAEAGSTHAWAEVFVPGAGWITFDPTNRSVGGRNLRVFRSSADREAQLLQSILAPALRSRNPERRKEAIEALENLASVTTHLKHLLLIRDLRKIAT